MCIRDRLWSDPAFGVVRIEELEAGPGKAIVAKRGRHHEACDFLTLRLLVSLHRDTRESLMRNGNDVGDSLCRPGRLLQTSSQ